MKRCPTGAARVGQKGHNCHEAPRKNTRLKKKKKKVKGDLKWEPL